MPKELHPYAVLLRPLITEKSTALAQHRKYVFQVDVRANKQQIREAVELAFRVSVTAVNTMNVRGKVRRFGKGSAQQPDWKKAIVTLQPGDEIELFGGV